MGQGSGSAGAQPRRAQPSQQAGQDPALALASCLLPPERGPPDGMGGGVLTVLGRWHVRDRSSQRRRLCLPPMPAQASYNHPPLLVTEDATPHCTL